jgi:hypothetical protein
MPDEKPPENTDAATVPSARLREETALKTQWMNKATALETELADLRKKAATVDTLTGQIDQLTRAHAAEKTAWETDRSIYQSGFTDAEGLDVARHLHSRLPEKDRPPLPDWLKALQSDPTKAPRALAPYLGRPQTPPAGQPPAASPPKLPAGQPPAGQPAIGSQITAGQLRELYQAAQRTGDWSKYKAAREAMDAAPAN